MKSFVSIILHFTSLLYIAKICVQPHLIIFFGCSNFRIKTPQSQSFAVVLIRCDMTDNKYCADQTPLTWNCACHLLPLEITPLNLRMFRSDECSERGVGGAGAAHLEADFFSTVKSAGSSARRSFRFILLRPIPVPVDCNKTA